jgi:chromosome segregation ATPase
MKNPFQGPIHELLINGRITEVTAEILTRHYEKQPIHFKEEMAAAPEEVNLAHLMRLIDLLEKRNEAKKSALSSQEPALSAENPPEIPKPEPSAQEAGVPVASDTSRLESEKAGLEIRLAEMKRKCEALEVELAAEKGSHLEFEKKAFDYAKRYADAEEERRLARIAEEGKRKTLEDEHRQLLEEVHRTREGEKLNLEKTLEGRSADLVALGHEKERLARELEGSHGEKGKALARIKELEEHSAQVDGLKKRCADLENEKVRALEDLAKTVKEMESRLNEKEAARVALGDELKKEKEMRAKIQIQFQDLEKTLLDLERQINALS